MELGYMSDNTTITIATQHEKPSQSDIEEEKTLIKRKEELGYGDVSDKEFVEIAPPLDKGQAETSEFIQLQEDIKRSLQEQQAIVVKEQHVEHKEFDEEEETKIALPDHPKELLNLPYMLGELQNYIYGRMTYPCRASAGIAALATMTNFVQTNILIHSRDGLGFNEYYMILAPTGFGKEDLRKPITKLDQLSAPREDENILDTDPLAETRKILIPESAKLHYAAPASSQGMHEHLMKSRSIFYLADEFAVWLKQGKSDSSKQGALGYLMEAYTRATGSIEPGNAVTKSYLPVKNPRVSVFSTSTGEAMLETMSQEDAESGAYNRWVIFAADRKLPTKKYTDLVYEPSEKLIKFCIELRRKPMESKIKFSNEATQKFIEIDQEQSEPIKRKDGILGGRLSEQAIKIAGLIALSDNRSTILPEDITTAFSIRMGIYSRTRLLAMQEGKLDGLHPTVLALNQITNALKEKVGKEKNFLYLTQFPNFSRAYKKLSTNERNQVENTLRRLGYEVPNSKGRRFAFRCDDV